jgi:hypothetical protein
MAFKREMVAEIARLRAVAARLLAELDEPMPGAEHAVVLEGHIEGDKVIVDGPPAPTKRR